MTTQKDLNKDMVALLSSVTDSIQELRKAVVNINDEIRDLKFDKMDKSSQNFRNNNFNDRLINLEENKIKVIDEYHQLKKTTKQPYLYLSLFDQSFLFILSINFL